MVGPDARPSDGPGESERSPLDFRHLYDREFLYVWESLRRLGVREADLEDVAHEVFVAVYSKLDAYDRGRPLRPWLFGFAFREASDYRRLARHQREIPDCHADRPDAAPAADERLATEDAHRLVIEALETLDMDARAVFIMHELDGLSIPEIAAEVPVPLNTLYSRLRLARKAFTSAVRRINLRRGEP